MLDCLRRSFVTPFGSQRIIATVDNLCRIHGPPGLGNSIFFNDTLDRWESLNSPRLASGFLTSSLYLDGEIRGRIWNEGLGYYGMIFYFSKMYEVVDNSILLLKGKSSSALQRYLCIQLNVS